MMIQTRAILWDAYRDLQSKKMFWITMILNILVILGFGMFGAKEHGYTFLWYDIVTNVPRALYGYKNTFSWTIVGIWFTWIGVLLAIFSTAGIFPDFLSSGSIDLFLAKPIGRLRLFLTKYLAGLAFATLQVTVFSLLSFFILGFRASTWEPGLFLAIPLVVVFFSYLFGICVFFGTLTRSTMASLILTILAWGILAGVDFADNRLVEARISMERYEVLFEDAAASVDDQIKEAQTKPDSAATMAGLREDRALIERRRAEMEASAWLVNLEPYLYYFKTITPKTRQTTDLLDRYLFSDEEMRQTVQIEEPTSIETQPARGRAGRGGPRPAASAFSARLELERERPVWWIIGTSLLFEGVCLALAAWHFCTRDF